MKKRSLSVIALAAAMSLSACGGNGTDAQKAEEITAGMVSAETTLPEETESSALSSEETSADTETSSPSEPVYCPYVIGYTEDEAMTELEPIGLNATISGGRSDEPAEVIILPRFHPYPTVDLSPERSSTRA